MSKNLTITYRLEISEEEFFAMMADYAERSTGVRLQDVRVYYEACLVRDKIVISAEKQDD